MLAIALLLPGTVRAETFRLVIGAGHPVDASVWITSMRDYFQVEVKKQVEAKTPHKIEWVEAYGGSIAKLGEVLEAVESGLMDIGDLHVPFEPAKLMAHNFPYFIPFGTPDPVMASKAARKVYDETPQLREILEKKYNQVYLATGAVGNYNLVTTFPWEKVEQLKGRKIAAAGPNIPWVQAIGAVPVQSNLNEAYTSLQTGVYQGWVMFPDAMISFKLHEVAKYYTFTDFGAIPNVLITINKNTWNKLPKEVQADPPGRRQAVPSGSDSPRRRQRRAERQGDEGRRLYRQDPDLGRKSQMGKRPSRHSESADSRDQQGGDARKRRFRLLQKSEGSGVQIPPGMVQIT